MRRLRQLVRNRLCGIYSDRELKELTLELCRNLPGVRENDFYLGTELPPSSGRDELLDDWLGRLASGEPLQYVVGHTDFCGCRIRCDRRALIPRPETSELVEWVIEEQGSAVTGDNGRTLLDVGTGTGCIAVALARYMPDWDIFAWDISAEALSLAAENCRENAVAVHLEQHDVLHWNDDVQATHCPRTECPCFHCIVSNPPYIAEREKGQMESNVLDYEPHLALFVPDDDPLRFYRAIAEMGLHCLDNDGAIYFEINPIYADELTDMLLGMGYESALRSDIQGRRRMLKTWKYCE